MGYNRANMICWVSTPKWLFYSRETDELPGFFWAPYFRTRPNDLRTEQNIHLFPVGNQGATNRVSQPHVSWGWFEEHFYVWNIGIPLNNLTQLNGKSPFSLWKSFIHGYQRAIFHWWFGVPDAILGGFSQPAPPLTFCYTVFERLSECGQNAELGHCLQHRHLSHWV